MLDQVKKLHDLGFAIHLLHPKSKRPIESGWTKGARKNWEELKKNYRPGMNVGVRLGKASRVGLGYLGVIDCDVKSSDPKHVGEMENRLREFAPEIGPDSPVVFSGRGNGSRHIYILSKEPIRSRRIAQSTETVEVAMPSITKASKREIEVLSPESVRSGNRLRPAWELSLMGEGSQVVLPPSLHPDTLRAYTWGCPFDTTSLVFLNEMALEKAKQNHRQTIDTQPKSSTNEVRFDFVEVDLVGCQLSDQTVDLIMTGAGCEDRSQSLYFAASEMVCCGFTDGQILSVLTDSTTFLGKTAFDHAKTTSRIRAAQWVDKFSLRKARLENDATLQFDSEVECVVLSDEAALEQMEDLIGASVNWRSKLERTDKGVVKGTLENIELILLHAIAADVFKRDLFAYRDFYGVNTPWGGIKGAPLSDDDTVLIKLWFGKNWGFEPKVQTVSEALTVIAIKNGFHPIREMYEQLPMWDGVSRIDSWFRNHFEAEGHPEYLGQVFRKWMVAAVTRIYEPGAKFDWMIIFEGQQDIGKSSFGRLLFGEKYYVDWLPNLADKEAALALQGLQCAEFSELADFKKNELDSLKAFLSRQIDKVRPPYGRRTVEYPRQVVFFGTVNRDTYLKDDTGNRRFNPVKVGRLDFDALIKEREQLWAEAVFIYKNCLEPVLFLTGEAVAISKQIQKEKMVQDDADLMAEDFLQFYESEIKKLEDERFNFTKFKLKEVFEDMDAPWREWRYASYAKIAGRALKKVGAELLKARDGNWWSFKR